MCNCNQKRAMYTSDEASAPPGTVKILLLTDEPAIHYGSITGRMYAFRNINDFNWVDKRDALSLADEKNLRVLWR